MLQREIEVSEMVSNVDIDAWAKAEFAVYQELLHEFKQG